MRRSPLQLFGDMVGMYVYLVAMGGLRYWPAIQQASIVEVSLPPIADAPEPSFAATSQYEYAPGRERTPAT